MSTSMHISKNGPLCRCGLRFRTRKLLREHVRLVHNAGKRLRTTKKPGASGKRELIKPADDRF